ncbi:MAG: PAS domain S-box protein, partial [Deltaproteobacteria bacterium]|nr:PAS domain S-box protein [Deltaproteobacteria bacterium]
MSSSETYHTPSRILIVEDQVLVARDLARTLTALGYEVAGTTGSGEEAIRIVEESRPHLVLMDINLREEMDGITAAEEIRTRFEIPIVYLTGYAEKDVLERAKRTEPYGYLAKPVRIAELRSTIETALYRHQADKRVRESEERFRLAMEATNDGIWDWDIPTGETYYSPSYFWMLGLEPGEYPPHFTSWLDLIHPEDRQHAWGVNQDCINGKKESFAVEFRMQHKDGSWRWILGRGKSIARDAEGKAIRLVGTHTDITERRQAEEKLRENERFLAQIFDSIQDGLCVSDKDFKVIRGNATLERWYPHSAPLEGKKCYEAFQGRNSPCGACPVQKTLATGTPACSEVPFTGKDGEVRGSLEVHSFPIFDASSGELTGVIRYARDVTERKRSRDALRDSQEVFSTFADQLPAVVFVKDHDSRVLYTNKYMRTVLACEDWIGRTAKENLPPELADAVMADDKAALDAGLVVREEWIPDRHGVPILWETRKFPINRQGKPPLLGGIAIDITARKKAEQQVEASLKEKEILLREILHRVKNNLAVIDSLVSLQSQFAGQKPLEGIFREMHSRIRSMAIAHELLFQSENLTEIGMSHYLGSLVDHLAASMVTTVCAVEIKQDFEDVSLGLDTAIPVGFLVTELISNCFKHAFPDRAEGQIQISLQSIGEGAFELVVADNGVGIARDIDWEDTKSMGLDLVATFVQQLRGNIVLVRRDGTEVRVRFKER